MRTRGVNSLAENSDGKSGPSTVLPGAGSQPPHIARGDQVLFRWSDHEALAQVTEKGAKVEGLGVFNESTVVGKPWGASVSVGAQTIHLLRPSLPDFVRLLKRGAQIITLKDAGAILANTGVGAGAFVVEFGVGSGALTLCLLHAVGPQGRVISVDNNPKSIEVARRNVARTPWGAVWDVREGDCADGVPETGVDAVVIDVAEPWRALGAAARALKHSGRLASFSPTVNQTERTVTALAAAGFADVRTVEVLEREHAIREGASRPSFEMLGHTGYLTFARKLG
jgi:tRNA (adenine57-N1/adenine58-N1)-methyltransferase catalytic subunit